VRRLARWAIAVAVVVVLLLDVAVVARPRQLRSYLTHWRGSPTHTEAYGPFPIDGQPLLHIAVVGDVGDSGTRLDATAAAVARLDGEDPFDVLLDLGDNAYPGGDPRLLDATIFHPFAPVLAHARLLAVLGNHDVMNGNGPAQVEALGMPGRWWSTTFGDVLIVGLDSNEWDDPDQLAWLQDTLSTSDARWKIVALHHPPYSAGYQGSSVDVRDMFAPVFAEHGVQLVLSGHDHDYQRSKPIDGVTYVVSGAAAGTRRTSAESFTAQSFSWHHFVEVTVFDDQLVVRAINQDLRVADEAVVDR
jgi:3',5'-cyclic AMP phosphodiesterase CpdA